MTARQFLTKVSQTGCEAVVSLSGELDVATSPELSEALVALIDGGSTELVIDLGRLAFIDSTGLSAILKANKKLEGRGRVVLRGPTPMVRQVLEITGLTAALFVEP
ncbi:MAG: STAS domain-containing protein [Acidimicrobiales bacterium]|jgi:anti-sigma B factor antagonist